MINVVHRPPGDAGNKLQNDADSRKAAPEAPPPARSQGHRNLRLAEIGHLQRRRPAEIGHMPTRGPAARVPREKHEYTEEEK